MLRRRRAIQAHRAVHPAGVAEYDVLSAVVLPDGTNWSPRRLECRQRVDARSVKASTGTARDEPESFMLPANMKRPSEPSRLVGSPEERARASERTTEFAMPVVPSEASARPSTIPKSGGSAGNGAQAVDRHREVADPAQSRRGSGRRALRGATGRAVRLMPAPPRGWSVARRSDEGDRAIRRAR